MTPLRRFFVLAAVVFASMPSRAADEDPVLSRAAYAAILKADELANLKVGVRVFTDGSAMLWGSASPADAAKAEAVLRKVPGITSVLNTCAPLAGPATAKPAEAPVLIPPPGIAEDRPTTIERKPNGPTARLLDPRPVDGPIDYAAINRVRRDAYDASPTTLAHEGQYTLNGVGRTFERTAEHRLPMFNRFVLKIFAAGAKMIILNGIIDQHMQRIPFFLDALDSRADRVAVSEIVLDDDSFAARINDFLGGFIRALLIFMISHRDLRAFRTKSDGGSPTDTR
jgi:hypothetical protein